MDNLELQKVLEFILSSNYHLEIISSYELGSLKLKSDKNTILVLHCSPDSGDVGHWIAFAYSVENNSAIYFDSYGLDVLNYVDKLPFKISCQNGQAIQHSNSNACGKYVVFFVYCIAYLRLSLSLYQVLDYYSSNTIKNDYKVQRFYNSLHKRIEQSPKSVGMSCMKSICMCNFMTLIKQNAF